MTAKLVTLLASVTVMLCAPSISNAQDAVASGDVRAPSPRIMNWDRPGYFQLGVGPAFASGLESDGTMYNIIAAYNYNLSDRVAAKAFSDFNLGTGSDSGRLINLGLGADVYLNEVVTGYGVPYLAADVGYGFARNDDDQTRDAVAVGAGAGFKFAAQSLNLDINLHYSILTQELDGQSPSVLALRAAVNF